MKYNKVKEFIENLNDLQITDLSVDLKNVYYEKNRFHPKGRVSINNIEIVEKYIDAVRNDKLTINEKEVNNCLKESKELLVVLLVDVKKRRTKRYIYEYLDTLSLNELISFRNILISSFNLEDIGGISLKNVNISFFIKISLIIRCLHQNKELDNYKKEDLEEIVNKVILLKKQ